MKVALTVWEGHISPLFDATRMLLIADIEGNRVTDRRMEPFDCASVSPGRPGWRSWGSTP